MWLPSFLLAFLLTTAFGQNHYDLDGDGVADLIVEGDPSDPEPEIIQSLGSPQKTRGVPRTKRQTEDGGQDNEEGSEESRSEASGGQRAGAGPSRGAARCFGGAGGFGRPVGVVGGVGFGGRGAGGRPGFGGRGFGGRPGFG